MRFTHHITNDVLIVTIESAGGVIDEDVDSLLEEIIALSPKKNIIAIDLSGKEFLNSTGLGQLIKIKDVLVDRNIQLLILNPSKRVKSLIDMVGVHRFFNFVDSEDEL